MVGMVDIQRRIDRFYMFGILIDTEIVFDHITDTGFDTTIHRFGHYICQLIDMDKTTLLIPAAMDGDLAEEVGRAKKAIRVFLCEMDRIGKTRLRQANHKRLVAFEFQHNGVHTKPLIRRWRTIIKDVSEMRVTATTFHFDTHHIMRQIFFVGNGCGPNRLEETGPSTFTGKFSLRPK